MAVQLTCGLLAGCAVQDVLPQGHAFGASAPELMSTSESVKQGRSGDQYKINGCAADMWSAGTVLYEMLTGQRAFNPTVPEINITPAQDRSEWVGTVSQLADALVSIPLCLPMPMLTLMLPEIKITPAHNRHE